MTRFKYFLTLLFLFLFSASGHLKPWEVNGQIFVESNKPVETHVFCSLILLKDSFPLKEIKNEVVSEKQFPALKNELHEYANQFLTINQKNSPVPVFVKEIQILTAVNEDDPLPPGLHRLIDVDVNFTLFFSTSEPLNSMEIEWKLFADKLLQKLQKEGKQTSPEERQVTVTIADSDLKILNLSSESPKSLWTNAAKKNVQFAPQMNTVQTVEKSRFLGSLEVLFILIGILAFLWIFTPSSRIKTIGLSISIIGIFSTAFAFDWSVSKSLNISGLPDNNKELKVLTEDLLTGVYSSASADSPALLFERLNRSTKNDFLDNSFIQLYKAKSEQPEVQTLVESVTVSDISKIAFNRISCSWQIQCYIRHQSHLHSKNLKFSGEFAIDFTNNSWQITEAKILPVFEDK